MICENCGAQIDESQPKCEYCGAIIYRGAEKKYKSDLKHIKNQLGGLESYPMKKAKKLVSGVVVFSLILITAILGTVMFVEAGKTASERRTIRNYEQKTLRRIQLQEKYFPSFDLLYENGNYEEVLKECATFEAGGNEIGIYDWEHFNFIEYYSMYRNCMILRKSLDENGTCSEATFRDGLEGGLELIFKTSDSALNERGKVNLSDADKHNLEEYQAAAEALFYQELGIEKNTLEIIYKQCYENGFFSYSEGSQAVERYFSEFVDRT